MQTWMKVLSYTTENMFLIAGSVVIIIVFLVRIFSIKREIKKGLLHAGLSNLAMPVFSGSFIQYWFSQNWDYARWVQELTMLHSVGIGEIILQEIADTRSKYAVYPTRMPGYSHNDIDMVGTVLKAADSVGMKVRIGLGFNSNWWIMNAFSRQWLNSEAAINKEIVKEIAEMYGEEASFEGWYIPHEFYQLTAITKGQQSRINDFLKEISSEIRQYRTKDIMIAPFYNAKYKIACSLPDWSRRLQNILKDTGIDIVALQDSIGAGYNSLKILDDLFYYTKKATDTLGIKLYADTETFEVKSSKHVPASQKRILEQLNIESKYVEGFVAFSISHYQNENSAEQQVNYRSYYDHYLINKE